MHLEVSKVCQLGFMSGSQLSALPVDFDVNKNIQSLGKEL